MIDFVIHFLLSLLLAELALHQGNLCIIGVVERIPSWLSQTTTFPRGKLCYYQFSQVDPFHTLDISNIAIYLMVSRYSVSRKHKYNKFSS
jgi:hypothetical protein